MALGNRNPTKQLPSVQLRRLLVCPSLFVMLVPIRNVLPGTMQYGPVMWG